MDLVLRGIIPNSNRKYFSLPFKSLYLVLLPFRIAVEVTKLSIFACR